MKQSFYNFLLNVPQIKDTIIYNSKTNYLAILTENEALKFKEDLKQEDWNEESWKQMIEAGFIVPKDIDEIEEIECEMNQGRFSNNHLSLTIAPTADCNFRCKYCYEKNNLDNQYMESETIDSIVKFIQSKAEEFKYLNVCWYGGEPLLCLDTIRKITNEIFILQEEYNFNYEASIVTNGYLLSRSVAKELNQLRIKSVQITLDGNKTQHDRRRILEGGGGTFDKIIANLESINDICPEIAIRINVDRINSRDYQELLDIIKKIDHNNRLYPYLGKVENYEDIYNNDLCMTSHEFYEEELYFLKTYLKDELLNMYPNRKNNYCCADAMNSYIISYDGKLYKCWSDLGNADRSVGKLKDGKIVFTNRSYYYKFLNYNPIKDSTCKVCKCLPICMGGCPYDRIHKEKECLKMKMDIKSYIKELSLNLIRKQYKELYNEDFS